MPQYRRESFIQGLCSVGYTLDPKIRPAPDNVLVIWNRYGQYDYVANQYEKAGGTVLVAENGYLGRSWNGKHWYAISKSFHNGGGWWSIGSHKRWDEWNVEMEPWRTTGEEIVILATRHIGPQGIREPNGWAEVAARRIASVTDRPIRIREHPGEGVSGKPLYDDLINAWACVTWGSGAGIKALLMGVPVFYGFPNWIGAGAAERLTDSSVLMRPLPVSRIPTFRSLAWAMWNTEEIAAGEPFKCLLQ